MTTRGLVDDCRWVTLLSAVWAFARARHMTLLALGEGSVDGFLDAAPLVQPLKEPKREDCTQHCHHEHLLLRPRRTRSSAEPGPLSQRSAHGSLAAARLAAGALDSWCDERLRCLHRHLRRLFQPVRRIARATVRPEQSFSGNRMRGTERFLSILGMAAWAVASRRGRHTPAGPSLESRGPQPAFDSASRAPASRFGGNG
jgi:hypothetical protein